jgi:hypothetical protein
MYSNQMFGVTCASVCWSMPGGCKSGNSFCLSPYKNKSNKWGVRIFFFDTRGSPEAIVNSDMDPVRSGERQVTTAMASALFLIS